MNTPKTLIALLVFLGLGCTLSHASTYYVRLDGGSATQCTGLANAAYPGSGVGLACAFNHPVWALGATWTKGVLKGGDTIIIDDTNRLTGSQAQYMIGYGMPNTVPAKCSLNWTYDCVMNPVPGGPDATHTTKIVGSSYNSGCSKKPQLWGTDSVMQILNLSKASNVEINCIEITDHSNCGMRTGNPICPENWKIAQLSGPYARNGIYAQGGSNFVFKNLDVHGLAGRGFLAGGLNGVIFSYVNMDGNYMANWDSDANGVGYNTGSIILDHVKNRFAGCSEVYPRSASFKTSDYSNCTDQNNMGYPGYGDGFGGSTTGGDWIISNSEFSHNTQDGIDLLYHDGTGSILIQNSLFEGNNGNQVKATSPNTTINNSIILGNCRYHTNNNKVNNTTSWANCRAGGDAIALTVTKGGVYKISNSTIYSEGSSNILFVNRLNTCDGSEVYSFRNNIFSSNFKSLFANQLGLTCSKAPLNTDYSITYNIGNLFCPNGSHNICNTDPQWVAPINQTADTNVPNITLQSTSPAIGSGLVIPGMSSLDYLGIDRGTTAWSMGAINKASTATPVVVSTTTTTPIVKTTTTSTSSSSPTTTTPNTAPAIATPTTTTTTTSTTTTSTTNTTITKPTTTTSTSTSTVKPKWMKFVVK